MRTTGRFHVRLSVTLLAAGLLLLGGCEAIFTSSPFTALQRNPSSLSPEQQITYAQDALASGDKTAMQAAYDTLKSETSSTAVYMTAELGIELSGVPTLLTAAINDPSILSKGDATAVGDYIAAHPGLQPALIIDAGQRLRALDAAGTTMTTNDRILGAIGLALGAATPPAYDFTGVDLTAAKTFLNKDNVVATASGADTLNEYLSSL